MPSIFCRFLLLLTLIIASRARAEVIQQFHAEIHAQKDTSLLVTEVIQMDFENSQRHGIHRVIPVTYSRNGGNYSIYLQIRSITDENGAPRCGMTGGQAALDSRPATLPFKSSFRAFDFYAWEYFQHHSGPRCELFWPEARRDATVSACSKWLERQNGNIPSAAKP